MEERQPATGAGEGGSGRKNPFDEALRTSDGAAQDSEQFSKTFSVRFMGSVQVPNDRGKCEKTFTCPKSEGSVHIDKCLLFSNRSANVIRLKCHVQ